MSCSVTLPSVSAVVVQAANADGAPVTGASADGDNALQSEERSLDSRPKRTSSGRPIDLEIYQVGVKDGKSFRFSARVPLCKIGSAPGNDLVIGGDGVAAFHAEVEILPKGVLVRDRSGSATYVDSVRVDSAWLEQTSEVRLGGVTLRLRLLPDPVLPTLSNREAYGDLVGKSIAMRRVFALLERCSSHDLTVLIHGETGTGKEATARAIHDHSPRAKGPFVVVDCGAIPSNLIESELFGHERGAFTGAVSQRKGAFEEADGGTIFLDEIGEIPLDIQPKLLRVLERRTVRRVGANEERSVNIRIVSATHRSLDREVDAGRFRSDLFFRLNVIRVELPPLRQRLDDLPLVVSAMLGRMNQKLEDNERLISPDFVRRLRSYSWPGNVRELRNVVERALIMSDLGLDEIPIENASSRPESSDNRTSVPDVSLSYTEARARALDAFERNWLAALVAKHDGNVTKAAETAGLARPYLHRMLKRHGIRGK